MHEVSLVESLVDRIRELALERSFGRVIRLRLAVGGLSGVEPEALRFCFPEVTRGSPLQNAELEIAEVPVSVSCRGCGADSTLEDPAVQACTACLGADVLVKEGTEFRIIDLEVV